MDTNDDNYASPVVNVYNEIQKEIKLKTHHEEDGNLKKINFSTRNSKVSICPTDAMRATAYTRSKDLSYSLNRLNTGVSFCIRDKRDVTQLITTVKHAKKQGCTDLTSYHCVKVGIPTGI